MMPPCSKKKDLQQTKGPNIFTGGKHLLRNLGKQEIILSYLSLFFFFFPKKHYIFFIVTSTKANKKK
jgi:hypothetical protein